MGPGGAPAEPEPDFSRHRPAMGQRPRGLAKQGLTGRTGPDGISPGKGRFGSIARGPLGQDRGKMLAIEATKGPRKTQDRGISPGKGRFGSIARGPWAKDRGKMLAKTKDRGVSLGKGRFGSIPRGPLSQDRGRMLAIEARHGAKMGPEGGSTQVNATEALLLPGPGLKIYRREPCPLMAPGWAEKGRQPRPKYWWRALCCRRGRACRPKKGQR